MATVLDHEWTRIEFTRTSTTCNVDWFIYLRSIESMSSWVTQAHHIFAKLRSTSRQEDFAVIDELKCNVTVTLASLSEKLPYLFLRAPTAQVHGTRVIICLPESDWMRWSFNQSGVPSCTDIEDGLPLPKIQYNLVAEGISFKSFFYDEMRRLYATNGFNPESEEIAKKLKLPLYQLIDGDICSPERSLSTSVVEEVFEIDDTQAVADQSEGLHNCDDAAESSGVDTANNDTTVHGRLLAATSLKLRSLPLWMSSIIKAFEAPSPAKSTELDFDSRGISPVLI